MTEAALLSKVIKEDLSEEMTFDLSLSLHEVRNRAMKAWGKNVPSRGK